MPGIAFKGSRDTVVMQELALEGSGVVFMTAEIRGG